MTFPSLLPVLVTQPQKPAISREGCRLDVVVQLQAPPLAVTSRRAPVAIAVVIDRSGSMAGPKLEAACMAAQQLVRRLTPEDRVAVISFDQTVATVVPLGPPGEETVRRIAAIRSGGSTALFEGWRQGMEALRQAPGLEVHQRRVLLLTDGQANMGPRRSSEVAPLLGEAFQYGISTSCIGLGDDYDERLLTAMAEAGNGNLVHLTTPEELETVFSAELEGLQLTIGRGLQLRLHAAAGVELRRIHNPMTPDHEGWIAMGALQAGSTASLALELQIPALDCKDPECVVLLRVQARWWDQDGQPQAVGGLLRLPQVEASAWQQLPSDPEVEREVALQQAARQRRQAMQGIDRGDAAMGQAPIRAALESLQQLKGSADVEREKQLLSELLELLSTDQLNLARKVMGTQAFMRARGRKLRDSEGRDDD